MKSDETRPNPPESPRATTRGRVEVAAAAVVRQGSGGPEVLIARRHRAAIRGDLWEFPGGKVSPGESPIDAARRELAEEVGVRVPDGSGVVLARVERDDPHLPTEASIAVTLVRFDAPDGATPRPIACAECLWERIDRLDGYQWPEANADLIAALRTHR